MKYTLMTYCRRSVGYTNRFYRKGKIEEHSGSSFQKMEIANWIIALEGLEMRSMRLRFPMSCTMFCSKRSLGTFF